MVLIMHVVTSNINGRGDIPPYGQRSKYQAFRWHLFAPATHAAPFLSAQTTTLALPSPSQNNESLCADLALAHLKQSSQYCGVAPLRLSLTHSFSFYRNHNFFLPSHHNNSSHPAAKSKSLAFDNAWHRIVPCA